MARLSGLIITPALTQRNVRVEMSFEPSIGILARKVDKLGLDIRSFREPLKRAVQQVVIPSIQMNFHKHGRPPWEPLSEYTEAQKGHSRILHRTGALRREMSYLKIWTIDSEKALIADLPDKVWYGKVHQAGASGSGGGMVELRNPLTGRVTMVPNLDQGSAGEIPQRRFAMIQPEDESKIQEVFEEWLEERIQAAGLSGVGRG